MCRTTSTEGETTFTAYASPQSVVRDPQSSGLFNRRAERKASGRRLVVQRVDLRLGDLPGIDSGKTAAVHVDLEHDAIRLGRRLLEDRLQYLNDEILRRETVVKQDDVE